MCFWSICFGSLSILATVLNKRTSMLHWSSFYTDLEPGFKLSLKPEFYKQKMVSITMILQPKRTVSKLMHRMQTNYGTRVRQLAKYFTTVPRCNKHKY